jgi:glutathione S-transferase
MFFVRYDPLDFARSGAKPSIADIRLAATLEFLAVVDYPLPAWAKTYVAAMEKSLGRAYAEPAADVREIAEEVAHT